MTSDAIFKPLSGERERITEHLRKLGMNDTRISGVARKYWRRHSRKSIPSPAQLERDLTFVCVSFAFLPSLLRSGTICFEP